MPITDRQAWEGQALACVCLYLFPHTAELRFGRVKSCSTLTVLNPGFCILLGGSDMLRQWGQETTWQESKPRTTSFFHN